MVVGPLGNESPDSNRFTLVTPKPENGVRLQATLGNQNPTGLARGSSQTCVTKMSIFFRRIIYGTKKFITVYLIGTY